MKKLLFILFTSVIVPVQAQNNFSKIQPAEKTTRLNELQTASGIRKSESDSDTYVLDSTVRKYYVFSWYNLTKHAYSYDSESKLSVDLELGWNSDSNKWINVTQIFYTGDTIGNITSETYKYWKSAQNEWINNYKNLFVYNNNQKLTEHTYQKWNKTSSDWLNTTREIYTYNTSGNKLTRVIATWDTDYNLWDTLSRQRYTYDTKGFIAVNDSENYVHQSWIHAYRTTYQCDTMGNQLVLTLQSYDTTKSLWVNHFQYTNTYDSGGNILSNMSETWDTFDPSNPYWRRSNNNLYTYDSEGHQLSATLQYYANYTWVNFTQYVYEFNSDGKQVTETYQEWNKTSNVWENSTLLKYSYNNQGNKTGDSILNWNSNLNSWDIGIATYYYWSNPGSTTNPTNPSNPSINSIANTELISIYPNPVENILSISGFNGDASCQIFDLTGKLQTTGLVSDNMINVENLRPGIYVIKLIHEQGTYTTRFIKN